MADLTPKRVTKGWHLSFGIEIEKDFRLYARAIAAF
jgi:hypothetical protein